MTAKRKDSLLTNALPILTPILAALVTFYSVLALIGWVIDSLLIARINTRFIPMAPATALCFVLMGAVLLLRRWRPNPRSLRRAWRVLAGSVLLFNVAILLQTALASLFDLHLDIEQRLVTASLSDQGYTIGVMSPVTAILFILLSCSALLSLPVREENRWRDRLAQIAAVTAFISAIILIVGYWYNAPLLYGGTITPVALTTAIAFLLLSGGFLFEGANAWFSHWVISTSVFSRFTRQVIPGTAGIVLILGWSHVATLDQWPPAYHALSLALGALFSAGFIALLTIVTARQTQNVVTQAERELRDAEENYRNLFENAAEGIFQSTPQGRFISVNPALVRIYGYESAVDMIASISQIQSQVYVDPSKRGEFTRQLEARGVVEHFESQEYRKDGSIIWTLTNARAVRATDGKVMFYEGFITDITERKRHEQERALLDRVRTAIAHELDLSTVLRLVVEAIAETFGYALVSLYLLQEETLVLQHQVGYARTINTIPVMQGITGRVARTGKPLLIEDAHADPAFLDAIEDIVSEVCVPLVNEGKVIGVLNVESTQGVHLTSADLNLMTALSEHVSIAIERARLYTQVRESEERYRQLFENSPMGIYRTTPDGRILVSNPALVKMLGFSSFEELSARNLEKGDADATYPRAAFKEQIERDGRITGLEAEWRKRDGTPIFVRENVLATCDGSGTVLYYDGTIEDITERKRAEEAQRKITERLSLACRAGGIGIWEFDIVNNNLIWDDQMFNLYGITPDKFSGTYEAWRAGVHPEDLQKSEQELQMALRGEKDFDTEFRVVWPAGTIHTIRALARVQRDASGTAINLVGTNYDITERKQAEEALRRHTDELTALQETILDISSPRSLPELLNLIVERAANLLGASSGGLYLTEPQQRKVRCVVSYKTKSDFTGTLLDFGAGAAGTVAETGQPLIIDDYSKWKGRANVFEEKQPFQAVMSAPMLWQGKVSGVIHLLRDDRSQKFTQEELNLLNLFANHAAAAVENARLFGLLEQELTERKRAEESLRESETKYRSLVENISDVIYTLNLQGQFTYVSPAIERIGKYTAGELIGRNFTEFIYPADLPGLLESFNQTLQGELEPYEYRILDWDGAVRHIRSSSQLIVADGAVVGLNGIMTDITARKQAEEALQQSEKHYRQLFENMQEGFMIQDIIEDDAGKPVDVRYLEINPAIERFLGKTRAEIVGKTRSQVLGIPDPAVVEANSRVVTTGQPVHLERYSSGAKRWYESFSYSFGSGQVATFILDITERKQAEEEIRRLNTDLEKRVEERTRELRDAQEQLVRQEKLAVLGQLAGGVGHELRNPLAVINNAVYYLKLVQPDADDKVKSYYSMIEKETHTAEKIITDLLDFARIKSVDREPVAVPELVQRVLERFPAPPSVEVALKLPATLPPVYADPRQMEQVLGNLAVNACQAMGDGGKLTISAKQQKGMVAIAVKDTGVGIPPENMKKLFEPLFTTKIKGIGLGLAVSKKLAEANGGRIEVQSEPGKGSTFTLVLPVQGA